MTPDFSVLLAFFSVVVLAVYFQTVAGFGLAMIVIGVASGIGIAPVADLATIVSILALFNGCIALKGLLRHIDWAIVGTVMAAVVPSSIAGVFLLDYLSNTATDWLQFILGLVIAYAGIDFALRHRPLAAVSGRLSFFAYGILGGVIGGMFGIAGPPLIFQFYRQPMEINKIRGHLILILTLLAAARTAFVVAQGAVTFSILWISIACIPVVAIATFVACRHPPRISDSVKRRGAFVVLTCMGVALLGPIAGGALRALMAYV